MKLFDRTATPPGPASDAEDAAGSGLGTSLLLLNIFAVFAIAVLDAVTPAGIVVGVLMVIPILAAALSARPRDVVWTFAAGTLAYAIATAVGVSHAGVPWEVRLPNRILVVGLLAGTAYLATALQHQRRLSRSHRTEELDAAQTNRLLLSLLVHDLRSPLITALHTLEYLWPRVTGEDQGMVEEARARLRRNVRLVDAYLAVAQADRAGAPAEARTRHVSAQQLVEIVNDEVRGFRAEAVSRGKQIVLYHAASRHPAFSIDVLVLRHALTILLDNAVRYALPGLIRVTTEGTASKLLVRVEDSGPGTGGSGAAPPGTGMGLDLCQALLRRAGGELRRDRADASATAFVLELPIRASVSTPAATEAVSPLPVEPAGH